MKTGTLSKFIQCLRREPGKRGVWSFSFTSFEVDPSQDTFLCFSESKYWMNEWPFLLVWKSKLGAEMPDEGEDLLGALSYICAPCLSHTVQSNAQDWAQYSRSNPPRARRAKRKHHLARSRPFIPVTPNESCFFAFFPFLIFGNLVMKSMHSELIVNKSLLSFHTC